MKELIDNPNIDKGVNDLAAAAASVRAIAVDGEASVKAALRDLPTIAARLKSTSERVNEILSGSEVQRILTGLAETAEHAGPSAMQLRKTIRRVDGLLASQQRDIEAIIMNLRKITTDLAAFSQDARDNPSRVIFGDAPPKRKAGAKR